MDQWPQSPFDPVILTDSFPLMFYLFSSWFIGQSQLPWIHFIPTFFSWTGKQEIFQHLVISKEGSILVYLLPWDFLPFPLFKCASWSDFTIVWFSITAILIPSLISSFFFIGICILVMCYETLTCLQLFMNIIYNIYLLNGWGDISKIMDFFFCVYCWVMVCSGIKEKNLY